MMYIFYSTYIVDSWFTPEDHEFQFDQRFVIFVGRYNNHCFVW